MRAGPEAPPIGIPRPDAVIVTSETRTRLESAGISGVLFDRVIKEHIVAIDWQAMDLDAVGPPDDGEPETLLGTRPHNQIASDDMGDLWEVVVQRIAVGAWKRPAPHGAYARWVVKKGWTHAAIFRVQEWNQIFLAENVFDALEERAQEWIEFAAVEED